MIIEPSEIDAIKPKSTHTIDIEEFVPLADIDPVYFEQPYYLLPDKQGGKAYKLLVEAMEGLQKVAIGRVVIRQKESLVAIRVRDGLLCLQMMRYDDEVIPLEDLRGDLADEAEPSEREVAMARQLVDALTNEFEPEKFHNEYRDKVLELIEQKAAGQEIVATPTPEPQGKVLDLMAALEASIAGAGKGPAPAAAAEDDGGARPRSRPASARPRSGRRSRPSRQLARRTASSRRTASATTGAWSSSSWTSASQPQRTHTASSSTARSSAYTGHDSYRAGGTVSSGMGPLSEPGGGLAGWARCARVARISVAPPRITRVWFTVADGHGARPTPSVTSQPWIPAKPSPAARSSSSGRAPRRSRWPPSGARPTPCGASSPTCWPASPPPAA